MSTVIMQVQFIAAKKHTCWSSLCWISEWNKLS